MITDAKVLSTCICQKFSVWCILMPRKCTHAKKSVEIPLHKVDFGITLILDNVHAFIEDARLLLRHSTTTHVVGLLEFAIQELGKAELIKQQFRSQMELRMKEVESGEVMHPRFVRINGFYSHDKKHKAGIKLLSEDVRKIEKRIFKPFAGGGFVSEDTNIDESLRLTDLYVNWVSGDWLLPSPTMASGGFTPSEELLNQLHNLASAIEEATHAFDDRVRT